MSRSGWVAEAQEQIDCFVELPSYCKMARNLEKIFFFFPGRNLKEMSMKSTLPVSEWYGMRPPPEMRMVGFRDRYSKTRAPELIPLTICSKCDRLTRLTHKNHFLFFNVPSVTHLSKQDRDAGQRPGHEEGTLSNNFPPATDTHL